MKISSEIKIGLVFIAALAIIIWGINFLKGRDLFNKQRSFFAVYERIDGLVKSNPVTINGLKVGQVKDVYFMPDFSGKIVVELNMNNDYPIPNNSTARIISSDLMGSKQIAIMLGNASTNLNSGDTLISDIESSLREEVNRQVAPLKRKAESLMLSIDSLMTVVSLVFNENTRSHLEGSIESIARSFNNLESTTSTIDTLVSAEKVRMTNIIRNFESISRNINNNNEEINNILQNFSSLSDSLAGIELASAIRKTEDVIGKLDEIATKINSGEGSLGMLINDKELYNELESSSKNLDLLIEDMRLNPERYIHFSVFGKSSKRNQYHPPDTTSN